MSSFWQSLLLILASFAAIPAVGLLISLLRRAFLRMTGDTFGYRAVFATSIIGTPIHELGHAIACILFAHRITDMRIVSFDPSGAALGYVKHTYNAYSLYQRIGNFFIGLAPIFSGCAVLFAGLWLLPGGVTSLRALLPAIESYDFAGIVTAIWNGMCAVFRAAFDSELVKSGWWWLYMTFGCALSLHIHVGIEDLRDCLSGAFAFMFSVVMFFLIAYLVGRDFWSKSVGVIVRFLTGVTALLGLSLLFSTVLVVLSALGYCVKHMFVASEDNL